MSDHISGPRALADPIADITDVYAFPCPEREGRLVLVMNTLPFAQPEQPLSEGLIYRFRVRPLTAREDERRSPFVVGEEELRFDCVFSEPGSGAQEGVCTGPGGARVSFSVDDEAGGERDGIRALCGTTLGSVHPGRARSVEDDRDRADRVHGAWRDLHGRKERPQPRCRGRLRAVPRREHAFGVVAETLTRGKFNVRIERVGRPEVKNMLLAPKQFDPVNQDLEIRDLYNMEDGFHLAEAYKGAYRARLNANLAFWDGLDGKTDWPVNGDGHPLTELWLADYLVVDTARPYVEQGSFLEIKRATREKRPYETCGGRTLNDDVMDTFFTFIITGGHGAPVRTGSTSRAGRPRRRFRT